MSASAKEPAKKESTVEKLLAKMEWLYSPNNNVDADPQHTKIWVGDVHLEDDSFSTLTGGFLGIGSYDSALAYYTAKIDSHLDLGENSDSRIQGKSDAGSYIIQRLHKDGQPKQHRIVLRGRDANIVTDLREYSSRQFTVSYGIRVVCFVHPLADTD
jgi:hypothetical protein